MNTIFSEFVLRADVRETATQRGVFPGQLVLFFVEFSAKAVFAGNVTLSDDSTSGETSVRRRLHNHELPCIETVNQLAIRAS